MAVGRILLDELVIFCGKTHTDDGAVSGYSVVAWVERSEIQEWTGCADRSVPDFAALNPGYGFPGAIAATSFSAAASTAIPVVSTVTRARA